MLWVPERVWSTERVSPLLRDEALINGGYDYVLLDDRLAYSPTPADGSAARSEFDRRTIPAHGALSAEAEARALDGGSPLDHLRPFRIEARTEWWPSRSEATCATPFPARRPRVAGPAASARGRRWPPGRRASSSSATTSNAPRRSGRGRTGVDGRGGRPVRGTAAVAARGGASRTPHGPTAPRLARGAAADRAGDVLRTRARDGRGETYAGWHDDPRWQPYALLLGRAEAITARTDWASDALHELAWKQLMACSNETAWQGRTARASGTRPHGRARPRTRAPSSSSAPPTSGSPDAMARSRSRRSTSTTTGTTKSS